MNEVGARHEQQELVSESVELTERVRRGDRAAFQALYERLTPALYAWVRLRLRGTSGRMDPQDILQDVWLRALRDLASFDPTQSFRRWIFGISKNVLLSSLREWSRHGSPHPRHDRGGNADFPDSVTTICSRLARDELVQGLLAYMERLSPEERRLVLYCGLEGYTSTQAAERLGILPDTALKRWQTLRARLHESGTLRALSLDVM